MNQAPQLTDQQKLVLNTLLKEKGPVSAYTLLDRLHDPRLRAPAQVYRALEKLIACGLVHKLESLNAFVACSHPHTPHNQGLIAFAICDNCGQAIEFEDASIEKRLKGWANDHAFKPSVSLIEMHGTCVHCLAT